MANNTKTVLITLAIAGVLLFIAFPDVFKDTASDITQDITTDIRGKIEADIEGRVPQCFELTEDFGLTTIEEEIDSVLTQCLDIVCTFNFDDNVVQFFAERNKQECIDRVTEEFNEEIQSKISI